MNSYCRVCKTKKGLAVVLVGTDKVRTVCSGCGRKVKDLLRKS